MNLENIATILAPTIFPLTASEYSTYELSLAISVLRMIVLHQKNLWFVPDVIANIILHKGENNDDYAGDNVLTSQEILLEYRKEVTRRKNLVQLEELKHTDINQLSLTD